MATSNRICLQCATPLVFHEASCSNCGARYPEPSALDSWQLMAEPEENSFQPVQATAGGAPFAHPSFDSGGQPLPPLAIPVPGGNQPPSPATDQPFPAVSPARKRPGTGLIIGISLLLAILLGGSLYFLLQGRSGVRTSTTTRNTIATISAAATSKPLFSDTFADNTKGWSTGNGRGFSSAITNNLLVLAEANHRIIDEPVPASNSAPASFTDFTVTTSFTIQKGDRGDSVGLYLRGDDTLKQGYFIDIFGDNSYDIVKLFADDRRDTFLVSPTPSSEINSLGQQNKLTVIMKGSKMVVLVNNKLVNTITDSGYTGGQIALFAENGSSSHGIRATFSAVEVFPAPSQLPA